MARMVKPHPVSHVWLNMQMANLRHFIAQNLRQWMKDTPELASQPKLAHRSGVAQSHIGRILREESAVTVDVLALIARAFRRAPEDLLRPPDGTKHGKVEALGVAQQEAPYTTIMKKLIDTANTISPEGQHVLLGRAEEIALQFPRAKANHSN